ncbi:cupin domain-containing protein, partial [Mariniblastus sp.]|nr:cupin domain-containing protein [Mariniblastus sp.]
NDRNILPENALEKFYTEGQRITNCKESLFEQYHLFEMNPGDGVYVPVTAPHWVRTLDEISISVSINFRTPSSIRRDRVYRMNRTLRKIGLRPHPVSPQANTWSDLTKSALLGGPATIKNLIRR